MSKYAFFILFCFLGLGASASAQAPTDCAEVNVVIPIPFTGWEVKIPASKGRPPLIGEAALISAARQKIEGWGADCDLPEVPCTSLIAGSVPVDDVLDGVSICVETIPQKKNPSATTAPAPGSYSVGNAGIEVTGTSINVSPDFWFRGSDAPFDSSIFLVHEAFHVKNRPVPASGPGAKRDAEEGAVKFTWDYLCALAGCDDASDDDKERACEVHTLFRIMYGPSPWCISTTDCPHCPPLPPNLRFPSWQSQILSTSQDSSELVLFPVGIDGAVGTFGLFPSTLSAQASWVGPNGWEIVDIDFNVDLPGFQPTCFTTVTASGGFLDQIVVGGYDWSTGAGELVSISYDPSGSPQYAITTIFDGTGMGNPIDLSTVPNAPSKMLVLAEGGTVSIVSFVGNSATVLATAVQAPTLANCRYFWKVGRGENLTTGGAPNTILLTAEHPLLIDNVPSPNEPLVGLFDHDGDYVIDSITQEN